MPSNHYLFQDLKVLKLLLVSLLCDTTSLMMHFHFQIETKLYQLCQELRQTIVKFYSIVFNLWEQLTHAELKFKSPDDTVLFAKCHKWQKVMHFMMDIYDSFESIQVSLLHQTPLLPWKLLLLSFRRNRKSIMRMQSNDLVMDVV